MTNIFNVFIACDYKYDKTYQLYQDICEYFDSKKEISIIDVSNYSSDFNNSLCNNVLKLIDDSELFICILTPKYNDEKNIYEINNNVLLELGYAISKKNGEDIYIFFEEGTNTEFDKIKPSMLSHVKYETYIDKENVIEFINIKFDEYEHEYSFDSKILNNKFLISLVKYDLIKILNIDESADTKIDKINNIIKNYVNDEIFQVFFDFSTKYISSYQLAHIYIDYFLVQIDHNQHTNWMDKIKNQKTLLIFFDTMIHILFCKYGKIKNNKINKNRKNFIILLFELLKNKKFKYKDDIKKIMLKSIKNNKYYNYEIYIYKLNGLYGNLLYNTNIHKDKYEWEDLILNSSSKIFNDWFISYDI